MTLRLISSAVRGLAVAAALLVAGAASAQVAPLPLPPPQAPAGTVRPIIGGHHVQPRESELRALGVQEPTRQQTQQMDRITRQLLDETMTGPSSSQQRP
jgi:hypothetical protein